MRIILFDQTANVNSVHIGSCAICVVMFSGPRLSMVLQKTLSYSLALESNPPTLVQLHCYRAQHTNRNNVFQSEQRPLPDMREHCPKEALYSTPKDDARHFTAEHDFERDLFLYIVASHERLQRVSLFAYFKMQVTTCNGKINS